MPKTIASGENITIPSGRVAVLPNVQIDGTLNVQGDVFIPSGATLSGVVEKVTSTDNAIVRFDGTTGEVQNSGVIIDDSISIHTYGPQFNTYGYNGETNSFEFVQRAAGKGFLFYVDGGTKYGMNLNSSGNLLVGTTTDNGVDKLQVNGSMSISDLTGSSTSFYQSGSASLTIATVGNPGSTATMGGSNTFRWVRIGKSVTISGTLHWTSISGLVDNDRIILKGLPFPVANVSHLRFPCIKGSTSVAWNVPYTSVIFGVDGGLNFIWGTYNGTPGVDGALFKAHLPNAGAIYGLSLTYFID